MDGRLQYFVKSISFSVRDVKLKFRSCNTGVETVLELDLYVNCIQQGLIVLQVLVSTIVKANDQGLI